MDDILQVQEKVQFQKTQEKKYLSVLPTTFSFVVSHCTHHPIPLPEKEKDTNKTALFCVLRKCFCEALWLDSELKCQNFRDGLSGREMCAVAKPRIQPLTSCPPLTEPWVALRFAP